MAAVIMGTFSDDLSDDDDEKEPFFTEDNVVGLHSLGHYFDNPFLMRQTMKVCDDYLNSVTVGTYLKHARQFHNEAILELASKYCVTNFRNTSIRPLSRYHHVVGRPPNNQRAKFIKVGPLHQ
jgi:hypothetical protein